ncbi:MAG: hypothetical protein H8E46_08510 [FCB group bacterium]|nr:hypothetical protein [FCB group bacterium]
MKIGIRREDKSKWERRVPLTPEAVKEIVAQGIEVYIQPSPIRIYSDQEYIDAGAEVTEDLSSCPVILAVKEIPIDFFEKGKTYMFFSHTIKGQDYNMPLLKRMMELEDTLIDYETVTDAEGRRLIFFGRQAGQAGMIDSLWTLGKRLEWEGVPNPFSGIKMAHEYSSLDAAKEHIGAIGRALEKTGLPPVAVPLVVGITGYGNVSQGAQEILDLLPVVEISPSEILKVQAKSKTAGDHIYKIVFKEEDIVQPLDAGQAFDLQDYYSFPRKYRSSFENYLPYLSMLVNCIYWEDKYPRLVTKEYLKEAFSAFKAPHLRVIGDISIDIEGSIECSVKATDSGNPVYVFDPIEQVTADGWKGFGPVIMAVDNLPCELPREASQFFSQALTTMIPQLAGADNSRPLDQSGLPEELQRAVILKNGKLTDKYTYFEQFL